MSASDGVDRRQLALVGVAILALVVAALLGPAVSGSQDSPDGPTPPTVTPDTRDGPSDQPSDGQDSRETVRPGDGDGRRVFVDGAGSGTPGEGGDARRIEIGGEEVEGSCAMLVVGERTPGAELTVLIKTPSGPLEGAEVFFEGESIGLTDAGGQVTGTVPYRTPLNISVSVPGEGCDFEREVGRDRAALSGVSGAVGGDALAARPRPRVQSGNDSTVRVNVTGEVAIAVSGTPYPGESVTIRASIEGRLMTDAAVRVDGERVATTDASGRASVSVPDDGAASMRVTVARGDFSGTRTVEIAVLSATVRPRGLLLLPGGLATVEATRGTDPRPNASVTIDGSRIGQTSADGALPVRLPTDLDATVTVTTARQSATVSLASAYRLTAVVLAVYLLVATLCSGLLARSYGRATGAVVGGCALAVLAVLLAQAYAGGRGAAAVALVVLIFSAVGLAYRGRTALAGGAGTAGSWLSTLPERLRRLALRATRRLEALLDGIAPLLERLASWLADRPATAAGLLRAVGAWVRTQGASLSTLPARLRGWLGSVGRRARQTLGAVRPRHVGAAALAGTLVLDGYLGLGWPGALLAGLGAVAVALVGPPTETVETTGAATDDGDDVAEPSTVEREDETPTEPSLREQWRRFARWVRPRAWRTSAPAEVAADARRAGYPAEAVAALTDAFREREYSERPLPSGVRERASEAYESLRQHRDGSTEGEER